MALDVDTGVGTVALERVLLLADPLAEDVWGCGPVGRDAVLRELDQPSACDHDPEPCVTCEARRIAWFVRNGVPADDPHPIYIDVGIPGWTFEHHWPIADGNHRVAALSILGAALVPVCVAGDIDAAAAWFAGDDDALQWL